MSARCLFAAIIVIALGTPSLAQQPGRANPVWMTDPKSGCRVWNPDPEPDETISWSGQCLAGMAQGRGRVQWSKDGKPNGYDEGEYRSGKQIGWGVRVWQDGDRYEGEFKDSERTGRGTYVWKEGGRYDGTWQRGKAHGHGKLFSKDGGVFEGTWINGCLQGARQASVGATREECKFK